MVLNNFKKALATYNFYSGISAYVPVVGEKIKSTNDDEISTVNMEYYEYRIDLNSAFAGVCSQKSKRGHSCDIAFGSGTTPVTENDYMLEKEIYQNIEYIVQTVSKTINGEVGKTIIRKVMKNNTGSPITIKEVGLVSQIRGNSNEDYPILLIREILDKPLTVPNGEIFSLEISFDIPA